VRQLHAEGAGVAAGVPADGPRHHLLDEARGGEGLHLRPLCAVDAGEEVAAAPQEQGEQPGRREAAADERRSPSSRAGSNSTRSARSAAS